MLRQLAPPRWSRFSSPSISARRVHIISTAPSADSLTNQQVHSYPTDPSNPTPDARFDVVGSPFSLLSVSLSASQQLYTRRGTLVGLSGKVENTISTLSVLEPFRRSAVGIPFLYQRISSTNPVTALISTKSPISSIVSVHLDGRQDWIVAQRQALLAWTGHTLSLKPKINSKLSFAYWGNTYVTGRGLIALVGSGQIYQVQLKAGESYVVHPSNVVAYSVSQIAPSPFRFKSTNIRFQVPDLGLVSIVQNVKFFRVMSETPTWRTLSSFVASLRTWARRSIWGDRLFLRFEGPSTILVQSRASRVRDVLSLREVNEIADSPPGAVQDALRPKEHPKEEPPASGPQTIEPSKSTAGRMKVASFGADGKVHIKDS
ncbi:hypothetical protein GQ43DRAFT_455906 [Delitschia confertaspora ATCC 74209]|uniref:Altered inheritance of mitochondria protein 24, mitochondrial n=1 Tax=Delitschia confertaspora ATCC 74209 TaxID=1513339 RepID=A0A9P4MSN8_9PLEO|nr:hypothetical protein GQ43DRAFT_455906 [Delitschia confertaspora ATCC 74209]